MTDGLPPVGTKVLTFDSDSEKWTPMYISGYTHGDTSTNGYEKGRSDAASAAQYCRNTGQIAAHPVKGQYHGNLFSKGYWKLADEPVGVDSLTDLQKKSLAKEALDKATSLGYCGEAKNVLKAMGLPTEFSRKRTVTVELEVTESGTLRFAHANRDIGHDGQGLMRAYNKYSKDNGLYINIDDMKILRSEYHD